MVTPRDAERQQRRAIKGIKVIRHGRAGNAPKDDSAVIARDAAGTPYWKPNDPELKRPSERQMMKDVLVFYLWKLEHFFESVRQREDELAAERAARAAIRAPRIGWWILALTCSPEQFEVAVGDLEEDYVTFAISRGLPAARWWFWIQIIKSAAKFAVRAVEKCIPFSDLIKRLSGR